MARTLPTVFISSTTKDLEAYRNAAFDVLYQAGLHPVIQKHFGPDHRDLVRYLRDHIAACDAVICLIGTVCGDGPKDLDPPRSYTQLEYDFALSHGIPVFVFLTSEDCDVPSVREDEERQERQLRHRLAVCDSGVKWEQFNSLEQLRTKVALIASHPDLQRTSGRLPFAMLHPPKTPAYFAGRQLEIEQLNRATSQQRPVIVAVLGLGGQGKSTLVAEWWRREDRPEFDAGFWCTAYRDGFTFDEFLDELLKYLLQGRFAKQEHPTLVARARLVIELLQERRVLLVIDGFERWLRGWTGGPHDPDAADQFNQREASFDGVDQFLSDVTGLSNGTHLILTSRALPAVLDDAEYSVVPVDDDGEQLLLQGLDEAAALRMLREAGVKGEDEELRRVAEAYDRHPLALSVLGTLLRARYGGRIERVGKIQVLDRRERLYKLLEESHRSLQGGEQTERFLHVATQCLEDPTLLTVAAGMGLDVRAQPELADDLIEPAIKLADWQLATWDGETERVGFHAIVKQYFAGQATDRQEIHSRLCDWYSEQKVPDTASSLEEARPRILAIEHALRAGRLESCQDLMYGWFAARYSFVEWLSVWGHLQLGIDLLGRIVDQAPEELRLQFLLARASMLRQLGSVGEALEVLNTIVRAIEDQTGERDTASEQLLATAYVNRGNALWQLYGNEQTLADYDRAVAIYEQLARRSPAALIDLAETRMNRGITLRSCGWVERALDDLDMSVNFQRLLVLQGDSPRRPSLAYALANRGTIRADADEHEQALADLREAVTLFEQELASGREELRSRAAQVTITLGATLSNAGDHETALRELCSAIEVLEEQVRRGRSDLEQYLALGLMNVGLVSLRVSRLAEAAEALDRAVDTFERQYGRGREDIRGWLGHAQLIRAEVRFRRGHETQGAEDRVAGFGHLDALAANNVPIAQLIGIRKSFDTADYLPDAESAERLNRVVDDMLVVCRRGTLRERFRHELRAGLRRISSVRAELAAVGLDETKLQQLESCLESC